MKQEKTKVYIYTRVSTSMQTDGYSLDAQKARMKAYADFNDYEIVGEYEDAGKSGKSIEGREGFNRMMEDIKSGKDGISYVLVFKLSRFGRNAADVLSTLQVMQDFGVNLVCVEDGIDSSKDAGKLMISVLSAVAEIERENIRVQTMEGRIQKAREGKWNGGFAPYGYQLENGQLLINEEEAEAIRVIFDQYVHTDMGSNALSRYLANHGIEKIQRQNGKNPLFDAALIRRILKNPVYCGKIAYGRRRTEKVHGTRNDYHLVEQDDYLLVDGQHEGIVTEALWQAAQVKMLAQAEKYEHVNRGKDAKVHLLSGIVKCPICGAGMYGNKSVKHKADGSRYKDFFYYGCKHRTMTRGHKCDFKKQINEELLDSAVAEVIVKLVSNPRFAAMMQEKISMKVDTSAIEQEIAAQEKQLRQSYSVKSRLMDEIDSLDPDDKHYIKRKADLDDRLYKMYDKIEDTENLLVAARAKKMAIEAEKLTGDNIYKVLICFDKLYSVMDDQEKRQLMESLISEIQIYEERQPNGQWLKSIKFKLPIIEEDMSLSLDNDEHVETVVCLSREKADNCGEKPKMISDERSKYKSWSNLKKQMNDLLCDSLKDKITYFYTSYHEVHNAYGRATINYCKKELVAFSWVEMYKQEQEVSQLYSEGKKVSYGEMEIKKWMPACKLCDANFINSLTIYLKTDIATSLQSDNYLLRVFAYMDRRVGKRTLNKIKDEVEKLPEWVKQFYQLRCEADGIVFPPKRITDETVVLLSKVK